MLMEQLKRNRKGSTGTVLAFILALLIAISLVQNIFTSGYTLTLQEWARTNEHITINAVYFDQGYNLILDVTNIGAVSTDLIAVWVEPLDPTKATMRYSVDQHIELQETVNVVLPDSGQLLDIFEEFRVTVFTERGNEAYKKYEYSSSPFYDPSVADLGVFRIEWFFNKYTSLQYPPDSEGLPVRTAVSINKAEDYIAFFVNVTNIWNYPCAVTKESFLGLPSIAPPQGAGEPNFFIVKAVDYTNTPSILLDPVFTPLVIYPQESALIIFAAKGCTSGERGVWRWGAQYPFGTEETTQGSDIQISLFFEAYKLEDDVYVPSGRIYGQTISTQATLLVSAS